MHPDDEEFQKSKGLKQPYAGGSIQTPNGSVIGQSPMNPSAGRPNTPTQTLNYATRPGTGSANSNAANKPVSSAFGEDSLANRATRPVGRSMRDHPERRIEMAEREAVMNNDTQGAAEMAKMRLDLKQQQQQMMINPGAGGPQMAGAANASLIGRSPMNWSAGAAARPMGRSLRDHPERRFEMAEREAVMNNDMRGAAEMAKMRLQGRAKGGPVKAGRPYVVGEKGPEIIVPHQSGTVVPNHALKLVSEDRRGGRARGKTGRQMKGLSLKPRPMPPEFARWWRQAGGRGKSKG
ncbi:hypothetical protein [Prosthecobacter sp.]|uniref:hypothetical protein n=1 Tax=Prosthecobacter sp. TaxID=1965333 RepID=UPI0037848AFC